MTIIFIPNEPLSEGNLIYLPSEFSFNTINVKTPGVSSILVNDINIDFSEEGNAVAVWGLSPHLSWREGRVSQPVSQSGRLHRDDEFIPGVSISANPSRYWPVTFDSSSGWLHIGPETLLGDDQSIEFVEGCVVTLRDGEIVGLWLHPDYKK